MPESFSNWDKKKILNEGFGESWKKNIKAGPVVDADGFFLNYTLHPYGGTIYYTNARGSGFSWWESFIYTGIMSTFMWEYGIEAFAEIPSWQDLIVTPTIGSALGECFFVLKCKIVKNDARVLQSRFLGRTCLILMDPMNAIIDATGYTNKNGIKIYSSITPINAGNYNSQSALGFQVLVTF